VFGNAMAAERLPGKHPKNEQCTSIPGLAAQASIVSDMAARTDVFRRTNMTTLPAQSDALRLRQAARSAPMLVGRKPES
jgi:hypothetical protein